MLSYLAPHLRVNCSRGCDKSDTLKSGSQLLRVSTFSAARTPENERDTLVAPQLHTEQSGFGGKDTPSVLASFRRKSKATRCSSTLPSKSIQSSCGCLAGFLTDASPNWNSLPGVFPQWRLSLQLSAYTVAGPCRIFTGFPIKRESHQTACITTLSTPPCQAECFINRQNWWKNRLLPRVGRLLD